MYRIIIEKRYGPNLSMGIYAEKKDSSDIIEYVSEIHLREIGSTVIKKRNITDLIKAIKFFIGVNENTLPTTIKEKFSGDESIITAKAVAETRKLKQEMQIM